MGWCNPTADAAIKAAGRTLYRQEQITNLAVAQAEFAKDMVSLPLLSWLSVMAAAPNLVGLAPDPSEWDYTWNIHVWTLPGRNKIVIGAHQYLEPATLFPLTDYTYLAASMIYGHGITRLNYDYQAHLYASLPSLENGGAAIKTVQVGTGTVVVDADGNVGPLAIGKRVINASGQVITYTGGTVPMAQLVITGTYLSGLKWSNGMPLIQNDLRLWDAINCDPASEALDYTVCERTASRQYIGDTTAVYTLVPGYLPQTYSTILPGAYPLERVLSDGRKLKDVPASEWRTLPKIIERPIGLGPYMITAWNKGVSMTFAANPYFKLGTPRTPNIEIRFLASAAEAVDGLLAGTIHVVGTETLDTAGMERVVNAARAGQIQAFVFPSAIWEHMDLNLSVVRYYSAFLPLAMN